MKKLNYLTRLLFMGAFAIPMLTACSDKDEVEDLGSLIPQEEVFGKANDVFSADEWYPGGQLGTTEKASYSAAAPAVLNIAGMEEDFNTGEDFFEHLYTFEHSSIFQTSPVGPRPYEGGSMITASY